MSTERRRWDIFCKVVDNFGDAGVCWRLARQLHAEHDADVRLWIDDLAPLARMRPGIDRALDSQRVACVDVRRWTGNAADAADPGDVVVEAFGCDPPPAFVGRMAARNPKPAWFNLEYLSAESWVETHHLLPSPHPQLPLTKYFFFPGFTARTGGLLREAHLLAARDAFLGSAAAAAWWSANALPGRLDGELRVSLFGYPNAAAVDLLDSWSLGTERILALVPDGVLDAETRAVAGRAVGAGDVHVRGRLRLARIPFLAQDDYDRLLWSCDANFVRGEDSFVRAQWAARPMVWHIYPQGDDAHRVKLAAFVERYTAAMPAGVSHAVANLFSAWNGDAGVAVRWDAARGAWGAWEVAARAWAERLADPPDFARQLVEAAQNRL